MIFYIIIGFPIILFMAFGILFLVQDYRLSCKRKQCRIRTGGKIIEIRVSTSTVGVSMQDRQVIHYYYPVIEYYDYNSEPHTFVPDESINNRLKTLTVGSTVEVWYDKENTNIAYFENGHQGRTVGIWMTVIGLLLLYVAIRISTF